MLTEQRPLDLVRTGRPSKAARWPPAVDAPGRSHGIESIVEAMLKLIGEVSGERALILGADGLEMMCSLLRRGVAEVTTLRDRAHLDPQSMSLLIVSPLASVCHVFQTSSFVQRVLEPGGRIIVRHLSDLNPALSDFTEIELDRHRFAVTRRVALNESLIFLAEVTPRTLQLRRRAGAR